MRREDAHAWAEVYFRNHGWVPFDGTRRSESYAGGGAARGQLTGLKYLFESSVGDDLIRAAAMAPARLSGGIKDAFNGPLSAGLAVVAVGAIVVALGWLGIRVIGNARRRSDRGRPYARLPGEGRREVLRTYGQVERLLRKNGVPSRTPGQTLQEYAGKASERFPVVSDQLTWFTRAAWAAAYDPGWRIDDSSAGVVDEARSRLSALKLDLRRISRYGFSG